MQWDTSEAEQKLVLPGGMWEELGKKEGFVQDLEGR